MWTSTSLCWRIHYGCALVALGPRCTSVMRSPRDSAMPCVLLRIRTCPLNLPSASSFFSTLTFTRASSPNTLTAYRLAACNEDVQAKQPHVWAISDICVHRKRGIWYNGLDAALVRSASITCRCPSAPGSNSFSASGLIVHTISTALDLG